MKRLFVNKRSQLRSGWKIAITFSSYFLAVNIISTIIIFAYFFGMIASSGFEVMSSYDQLSRELTENQILTFILLIVQAICMLLSVFLFWKLFEKRPIKEIGFVSIKTGYKDLVFGLIFGAVSITAVFIILLISGNISVAEGFSNPNFTPSLITGIILFIFVGINEEVFARGYCMNVLKQTGNKWVVALVSSAIFSVMHSLNPEINIIGFVNIFLVGLLFAFMFLKSGSLLMPIGYHITWNYFQGNVFGFRVSGLKLEGLYKTDIVSDNILNGGYFGPEGGLVTTAVLLMGFIVIWMLYERVNTERLIL